MGAWQNSLALERKRNLPLQERGWCPQTESGFGLEDDPGAKKGRKLRLRVRIHSATHTHVKPVSGEPVAAENTFHACENRKPILFRTYQSCARTINGM